MKLFIKALCAGFILTVVYSMVPFQAECADISDNVFRLHILANSDSGEDQALKLRVRDRILELTSNLFENTEDKETAERLAAAHLQELADAASEEIAESGYAYPVRAELTRMPFDTRRYDDFTLPSGIYDALRITIGEGKGHNWWCVMFPSLCVGSPDDGKVKEALGDNGYEVIKNEKREYKFFIIELFENISQIF